MRRPTLVIALALMLLTGLVLGQLYMLAGHRTAIASAADPSGERTATRFYESINWFLKENGPPVFLDDLHPDFVDHSAQLGGEGSGAGLEQYLSSVRSTFPGLSFDVGTILGEKGLVAVDLSVSGTTGGEFARLKVKPAADSRGYELLRIEGDQILERWGSSNLPALYETMTELELPLDTDWVIEPHLERRVIDPGMGFDMFNDVGTMLVVESGSMTLNIDDELRPVATDSWKTALPPDEDRSMGLRSGMIVPVPSGQSFIVLNSGEEPATVLMLTMRKTNYYEHYYGLMTTPQEPPPTFVAGGLILRPHYGPYVVSAGRALLPPGSEIPSHLVAEAEFVTVVSGSVEATATGKSGTVWLCESNSPLRTLDGTATLLAGDSISADNEAETGYRVSGSEPAEIWLFNIVPVNEPAS